MTLAMIAASAVALSITNAADYISTVPVATNLIRGIGMGSGGAYRALRAEDAEFLLTAYVERLYLAAQPFPGILDDWGTRSGRVPVEGSPLLWREVLDLDFRMTCRVSSSNDEFTCSTSGASYGFVPQDWEPWTGYLVSTNNASWIRNGYNAATDIRAVFGSDSAGIPAELLPTNLTLLVGAPSIANMTNAYALIEGDITSTILQSSSPTADCATTNATIVGYNARSFSYNYTTYTIGNTTARYLSSVTPSDYMEYGSTNTETVAASSMACHSQRTRYWTTFHGVEYSTEPTTENPYPGGTVHTIEAQREGDYFDESLPGEGDLWLSIVPVVIGWTNVVEGVGRICNTNMTMSAFLVCCWTCTTTDNLRINYGFPPLENPAAVTTNYVKRLLSSHSLGEFEITDEIRSGVQGGYVTPNVWRAVTARVHDVQSEALLWAEALRCFEGQFFSRPPVGDNMIPQSAYPSTVTNGWIACGWGSGSAITSRRNDFSADRVYLLLVIHPTYHARVLGPIE